MKLHVVIALCTCLVYTNAAPANIPFFDAEVNMTEYFNDFKQHPNDYINGVGDQFVDDVLTIYNAFQNETLALKILYDMVQALSTDLRKKDNSKIDEHNVHDFAIATNAVKALSALNDTDPENLNVEHLLLITDSMKIQQTTWSKKIQPERLSSMIRLMYVLGYPNATSDDTEKALNYLYGTETAEAKASLFNLPEALASDCPNTTQQYSDAIKRLKTIIDIRPKVVQDFNTIRDKFPCYTPIAELLELFVMGIVDDLHGDKTKLTPCIVKEKIRTDNLKSGLEFGSSVYSILRLRYLDMLKPMEYIFSSRMSDESFRGIVSVYGLNLPFPSMDEIETGLAYLYDDVPKADCP